MRQWEAKERAVGSAGEVQRADWARANLEKAVKKAKEKRANVEQLEILVARLEDCVGRGRKVKVEVEEVAEEMVKEEVGEELVEDKVQGTGMAWLRGFLGNRGAGAIMDMPWDPSVVAEPHPLGLDVPLLPPPESSIWALRFVMQRVHHKILGQARWVRVDERGVHEDKPLQVGEVQGEWHWKPEMPGGKEGTNGPTFRQGGEDV